MAARRFAERLARHLHVSLPTGDSRIDHLEAELLLEYAA